MSESGVKMRYSVCACVLLCLNPRVGRANEYIRCACVRVMYNTPEGDGQCARVTCIINGFNRSDDFYFIFFFGKTNIYYVSA